MNNIQLTVFGNKQIVLNEDDLPRELADAFANLDDKQQAEFWDCLALITGRWERLDCFQWALVEPLLTDRAKRQIQRIAEYA